MGNTERVIEAERPLQLEIMSMDVNLLLRCISKIPMMAMFCGIYIEADV